MEQSFILEPVAKSTPYVLRLIPKHANIIGGYFVDYVFGDALEVVLSPNIEDARRFAALANVSNILWNTAWRHSIGETQMDLFNDYMFDVIEL